jgi:hypothetical protein
MGAPPSDEVIPEVPPLPPSTLPFAPSPPPHAVVSANTCMKLASRSCELMIFLCAIPLRSSERTNRDRPLVQKPCRSLLSREILAATRGLIGANAKLLPLPCHSAVSSRYAKNLSACAQIFREMVGDGAPRELAATPQKRS